MVCTYMKSVWGNRIRVLSRSTPHSEINEEHTDPPSFSLDPAYWRPGCDCRIDVACINCSNPTSDRRRISPRQTFPSFSDPTDSNLPPCRRHFSLVSIVTISEFCRNSCHRSSDRFGRSPAAAVRRSHIVQIHQ